MNTRCFLPLLLLALCAPAASAGPTEDLARVLREASQSGNPTISFLQGVGRLGDVDLNTEQVRRALTLANLPAGGALHAVLGPTTRIIKKGDRIELRRSESTTLEFEEDGKVKGRVRLKSKVTLRLRLGERPKIDKVRGIKVGEGAKGRLYDLWRVEFYRKNKRQFAAVTAGALIFSKTIHLDLTPKPEPEPKVEAKADGLAQALGALGS